MADFPEQLFLFVLQTPALAQSEVTDAMMEVTPGRMLAAFLVLSIIAAGCGMMGIWGFRLSQRRSPIPRARRPLSPIPVGLLIAGLAWTLLMGAGALAFSLSGTDIEQADATDPITADADTEPQEPDDDEHITGTSGVPEVDSNDDEATSNRMRKRAWETILSTLIIQFVMFCVFGGLVLAFRQPHQSRSTSRLPEPAELDGRASTMPSSEASAPCGPSAPSGISPESFAAMGQPATADEQPVEIPESFSWTTEFRWAAETFLAAYVPTTAARLLMVSLDENAQQHEFLKMLEQDPDWTLLAGIVFLAAVVAPIVEELLYRVVVLGGMLGRIPAGAGILISSLLFGAAHGYPDAVSLLPLAAALAYCYQQRRSYLTVVLVHFFFNAFNLVVAGVSLT